MKFTLNQPQTFSEQGQKSNQEDRIAPVRTSMNRATRCFVLCDGMGGHEHGEVAAEIVSQSLYEALTAGAEEPDLMSDERFKIALAKSYTALDRMEVGEGKRPGTTMTCLYFAENGVLAAHIGDSRIYQIRPGRGVIFKTRDHSLVNDLIRAGELTEEEAVNYPRKNVITRAMQPGLDR
ncbi:MAG: protein phosphatase 2C domain-containing protein, partial [Muribaculaceae bacterium]|nr:protein phosphatase 2C domain-containing protein [Muribaculaceae bacterium]